MQGGDVGFLTAEAESTTTDLGLYFGSAELAREFLGRRAVVRERALIVWGLALALPEVRSDCSPDEATSVVLIADNRFELRVMVLASGVASLSFFLTTGGAFSVEDRFAGAWEAGIALERREDIFLLAFSFSFSEPVSFASLCMTSTIALPIDARLSECRMELRVLYRGRNWPPG